MQCGRRVIHPFLRTYPPPVFLCAMPRCISPQAPSEGRCWHADHKLAVRDGGGECDVENMQTLCVACHQRKTGEEAQARRGVKRPRGRKCGAEAGGEGQGEGASKVRARARQR